MTHARLHTRFCELVGVEAPIVQTGMGWVAGAGLVSATAEAGALGILASATMDLGQLRAAVATVKSRTAKPFGVNLRADAGDIDARIDVLITEGVRVASFAQAPRPDLIERLHAGGVLVVPSIGAVRHAEKVLDWGVHALVVQGGEGGGHTGSVPTSLLLPQVVDAVAGRVPVVAAGGYYDGRGLVAALAYGAAGIAMGTRFLMTAESPVPPAPKAAYVKAGTGDIAVTTKVDGIPQRMILNPLLRRIERSGTLGMWKRAAEAGLEMKRQTGMSWGEVIAAARTMTSHGEMPLAQAMMAAAAPMLIQRAVVAGDAENGLMATGVVAGRLGDLPTCAELLASIEAEALARIAALTHREPAHAD